MNHNRTSGLRKLTLLTTASLCFSIPATVLAADNSKEVARITAAGQVLNELADSPSGIPINLLNRANCVIVLPSVKKGGFIVGAEYGRGVMVCRRGPNFTGASWSAPSMMQSAGGSIGFQAGGEATDFVILVMNEQGARAVMNGKAKLGADASIAAGPVGRDAEAATNETLSAQMLSYSRTKGVFGGVSLEGSSLGPDKDANEAIYGKGATPDQIIKGNTKPPAEARELLAVLTRKSPKYIGNK